MVELSKQDGYASRTAADLERKYNFGKTFAEISGIATDARTTAVKAGETAEKVEGELDTLFAKDIVMEGTFTYTVETFLYPEEPELEALRQAFQMYEEIYRYLYDDSELEEIEIPEEMINGIFDRNIIPNEMQIDFVMKLLKENKRIFDNTIPVDEIPDHQMLVGGFPCQAFSIIFLYFLRISM